MEKPKKYLQLNDLDAYKLAFHLSNYVWEIIMEWDWLSKKTVGIQFINAVDSISANIAEGFGRYHKKDKIKFYRYSQGSLKECFDWNAKSKKRKLIDDKTHQYIFEELRKIEPALRQLIKYTDEKLKI